MAQSRTYTNIFNRIVLVAGLGYFVDVYDLVLFAVVRQESLRDLGVPEADILDTGLFLLSVQMIGMLVGGFLWGMLGDKRGRLSTLFGAIALYSVANIVNGFVTNVPFYAIVRFIAGVGLAGELGAGVTLVSETMPKNLRGYGITVVTSLGILGAVFAEIVAQTFDWKIAYIAGGVAGLVLLGTQVLVAESGAFEKLKLTGVSRGDLRMLFFSRRRLKTYLQTVLIGIPVWYTIALLITISPELSAEMGLRQTIDAGQMIAWNYGGAAIGGVFFGYLSERMRSRKWSLIIALAFTAACMFLFVFSMGVTAAYLYGLSFAIGFGTGYWPVFFTTAAEQFGTNLRATVTTTAANLVRGAVVPATILFDVLVRFAGMSLLESTMIVGTIVMLLALYGTRSIKETYGTEIDFVETDEAAPTPKAAAHAVGR
ncbi:MAG TPA: MFS transporter [Candidatus Thermoplasmatota archaeon]